jgi:DNA mismatch endonuclease (patch repair protein)
MASIRKRDTRPELTLRRALWAAGVRGWRCHARLPGTPDVAFRGRKVAVFVDGVWWHGHPDYLPRGRRGAYWDEKIAGNVARDRAVDDQLSGMGWRVVRIWDIDVLADAERAVQLIGDAIARPRNRAGASSPARASVTERIPVERVTVSKLEAKAAATSRSPAQHFGKNRLRDHRGQ